MAKVVLVLVAFLAVSLASCYEQCTVDDRRTCWDEWEDCTDNAQTCEDEYCECLRIANCENSREWHRICLGEEDEGGG